MALRKEKPKSNKKDSLMKLASVDAVKEVIHPCIVIIWSRMISYFCVDESTYAIQLEDYKLDGPSKSILDAALNMANYCDDDAVLQKTIIRIVSDSTAELITVFTKADSSQFDKEQQKLITGMMMYFVSMIHDNHSPELFSMSAREARDTLPDEYLEFCSNEVRNFLLAHGYKNIRRKMAVETGGASILLDKSFSARPKPEINNSPYALGNLILDHVKYPQNKVVLHKKAGGKLIANIMQDNHRMLDKLHAAGKKNDVLQCKIKDVIGAQNKLEHELLSVELQPISE